MTRARIAGVDAEQPTQNTRASCRLVVEVAIEVISGIKVERLIPIWDSKAGQVRFSPPPLPRPSQRPNRRLEAEPGGGLAGPVGVEPSGPPRSRDARTAAASDSEMGLDLAAQVGFSCGPSIGQLGGVGGNRLISGRTPRQARHRRGRPAGTGRGDGAEVGGVGGGSSRSLGDLQQAGGGPHEHPAVPHGRGAGQVDANRGHVGPGGGAVDGRDGLAAEAEDLLRDADAAIYKAKATGKDRYVVFD